jgi:transposase
LGIDAVNELLSVIEVLNVQIRKVSARIRSLAHDNEDAVLLTTIPRVGYYDALLLVAKIDDMNRFPGRKAEE